LNQSTIAFIQCLQGAITFSEMLISGRSAWLA